MGKNPINVSAIPASEPSNPAIGTTRRTVLPAKDSSSFKIPMAADLRTRTLSETRGFMKALVASDSDRILGFSIFGVDGGEIMAQVQIAMIAGLPYTGIRDAILTHPTLAEGLIVLFSSAPTLHTADSANQPSRDLAYSK